MSLRPAMSQARRYRSHLTEHFDNAFVAVDADAVAALDDLRRDAAAHPRGDAELARQHRRVPGHAGRVGDERGDLGEEDHPRGVGHLADEDVTRLDLVELVL